MKKEFNNNNYKQFAGKYIVQPDGRIFLKNGKELNYFKMSSGGKFVRINKNAKSTSLTIAKIVLLTFKPRTYRKDKIAIHLDGNVKNNFIKNLKFGTRQEQSIIHVENPKNWKRISKLGKKYGPANGRAMGHIGKLNLAKWKKENNILEHSKKTIEKIHSLYMNGKNPSEISKKLKISRSSIYNHI